MYTDADLQRVLAKMAKASPGGVIEVTEAELEASIKAGQELYGDFPGFMTGKKKLTLRQRLVAFSWRVRDAWAVLRGRADIC